MKTLPYLLIFLVFLSSACTQQSSTVDDRSVKQESTNQSETLLDPELAYIRFEKDFGAAKSLETKQSIIEQFLADYPFHKGVFRLVDFSAREFFIKDKKDPLAASLLK